MIIKSLVLCTTSISLLWASSYVSVVGFSNPLNTWHTTLIASGHKFLSDLLLNQDSQWSKEYEFYKTNLQQKHNINSLDSYKSQCISFQNKLYLFSVDHSNFLLDYCVLRNIESHIALKESIKILLSKYSDNKDWELIYETNKSKLSFITKTPVSDINKPKIIKELRGWCHEHSKKDYLASEEDNEYKKVIEWCTKSKS